MNLTCPYFLNWKNIWLSEKYLGKISLEHYLKGFYKCRKLKKKKKKDRLKKVNRICSKK